MSEGTLTLASADRELHKVVPFEYAPKTERNVSSEMVTHISRVLKNAIAAPTSVLANSTLAATSRFTGDIMAYTFYRHFYLQLENPSTAQPSD